MALSAKNKKKKICSFCSASSFVAKRCSQCQAAWYCSSECQIANWSTHKLKCSPNRLLVIQAINLFLLSDLTNLVMDYVGFKTLQPVPFQLLREEIRFIKAVFCIGEALVVVRHDSKDLGFVASNGQVSWKFTVRYRAITIFNDDIYLIDYLNQLIHLDVNGDVVAKSNPLGLIESPGDHIVNLVASTDFVAAVSNGEFLHIWGRHNLDYRFTQRVYNTVPAAGFSFLHSNIICAFSSYRDTKLMFIDLVDGKIQKELVMFDFHCGKMAGFEMHNEELYCINKEKGMILMYSLDNGAIIRKKAYHTSNSWRLCSNGRKIFMFDLVHNQFYSLE